LQKKKKKAQKKNQDSQTGTINSGSSKATEKRERETFEVGEEEKTT